MDADEPQHDAGAIALFQTCGCLLALVAACVTLTGLAMRLRVVLGI